MLDLLRKKAQSPLIQGIILIIALVFIFWGVGGGINVFHSGLLQFIINNLSLLLKEADETILVNG